MADETLQIIYERAGYGLARGAWVRTLHYIRSLPTAVKKTV